MSDTLLLNADGAPLSITPLSTLTWQESIKLIWLDKINVLDWHDDWEVHSPNHTMKVPAVIAIRDYNKSAGDVNFSRKNKLTLHGARENTHHGARGLDRTSFSVFASHSHISQPI